MQQSSINGLWGEYAATQDGDRVALIFFATPAFADKFFAVTPSGAAEMLFPDKPQAAIAKLSHKCIDMRWTVIASSSNELTCEAPLNMGQSILGQMLMGNSYSTPPRRFFRFNAAEVGGISRVQASGWMELQMAFGQIKRTDFSGPEFQNSIFDFMASVGGKYPPGTTFPNHVVMGFQGANVPQGKDIGIRVTEIVPDSAAAKAGILVGDVVTRIAHKQFKNAGDYLDATSKAAETPTYEIDLLRDGKPVTVVLARMFRPAIVGTPAASVDSSAGPPPASPSSVADEIAKLAKLRDQGIITDAEFEAQKKKLLGQ